MMDVKISINCMVGIFLQCMNTDFQRKQSNVLCLCNFSVRAAPVVELQCLKLIGSSLSFRLENSQAKSWRKQNCCRVKYVRHRKTNAIYHIHVESKKYNQLVSITKKKQTSGDQWGQGRWGGAILVGNHRHEISYEDI